MRDVSEKEYRARWDAETLAQAKEIESDPNRLAQAKTAAQQMADDEAKKTKHLRQVAGRSPRSQQAGNPKPRTNRQSTRKGQGANPYNVFQKI